MKSPKIMRTDDLRAQNRHLILSTLREQGALSRAEIGRITGLSQAALSTLFGMMTEQGLVTSENNNPAKQKRGRPSTTVALDPSAGVVVTVAVTMDCLRFSLVDYAGDTQQQTQSDLETQSLSESNLTGVIVQGINKLIESRESHELKAICIGFQGVTDSDEGVLLWSPILSSDKLPIRSLLSKHYNVPVLVNNDSGLIAKALHAQESENLSQSFATVHFSHGIGLGLFLNGEPFNGAYSSALELGHVIFEKNGKLCRCGKHGCIEAYASTYGIVRNAFDLPSDEIPSVKEVDEKSDALVRDAQIADSAEHHAFKVAGEAIGFGLVTVFTLLDPLPVALVGDNADAIDLMRADIEDALSSVSREPNYYSTHIHSYHDSTRLLHDGLILETMLQVDKLFAENSDDLLLEDSQV